MNCRCFFTEMIFDFPRIGPSQAGLTSVFPVNPHDALSSGIFSRALRYLRHPANLKQTSSRPAAWGRVEAIGSCTSLPSAQLPSKHYFSYPAREKAAACRRQLTCQGDHACNLEFSNRSLLSHRIRKLSGSHPASRTGRPPSSTDGKGLSFLVCSLPLLSFRDNHTSHPNAMTRFPSPRMTGIRAPAHSWPRSFSSHHHLSSSSRYL